MKLSIRKSYTAMLGAAAGLTILAAAWIAREVRSPAQPAPPAPAPVSGSDSSVKHRRSVAPRGGTPDGEPDSTRAQVDAIAPGSEAEPRRKADVRPAPPPEAFLPAEPRTRTPDRDTGLVFHNEPPVDGATTKGKAPQLPIAQAPPEGPRRPSRAADVRPPPDPAAWVPDPPRTGPDRDTGLVFSNQPRASEGKP